jgi:hypothetical protein
VPALALTCSCPKRALDWHGFAVPVEAFISIGAMDFHTKALRFRGVEAVARATDNTKCKWGRPYQVNSLCRSITDAA